MASQLDILALEPFYGGIRRAMLDAVVRCSRHRWTLLKLPPRRMERRLSVAASWFAEQLCRHFSGHVDVLFTSEAMNLANLLRLVPELASRPSVVYFHENQLPEIGSLHDGPLDLVNLNTATSATEIWFNSRYHLRTFLMRASSLVARHPELSSRDPMPDITGKAHIVPPPLDLSVVANARRGNQVERSKDTIFVETRGADVKLLNAALDLLHGPGRDFKLITVGPVEHLSDDWDRQTLRESDDVAHLVGMMQSRVLVSAKPGATSDYHFLYGMLAGCQPVVPSTGCYPELLPEMMHHESMYQPDARSMADQLAAALNGHEPMLPAEEVWRESFRRFDAITACRILDERLERLAGSQANGQAN